MTADSFIADLHIHSRYAYACSKALTLDNLALWARRKGIDLLATGDFTHPQWAAELRASLVMDAAAGLYRYEGMPFVPGAEISCVYRQDGRVRRLHLLILMPTLDAADLLTRRLASYGSLHHDGRPTVSLSARDLTALALEVHPDAIIIPAHAWTPWFGVYGSKTGFDTLADCFGDLTSQITAVETGLSSDPIMNRAVPELDGRAVVSFSDAHSPQRLGRELTAFRGPMSWPGLAAALRSPRGVAYTVEFYPEEGKYHYSGHRKCGVSYDTAALDANGAQCPVCGRPLTLGVLHRVSALSQRPLPDGAAARPGADGFIRSRAANDDQAGAPPDAPFARLIPLAEIIAAVHRVGVGARRVTRQYEAITNHIGSELDALLYASESDLRPAAGETVSRAIIRARAGQVAIAPGYDGQYGKIALAPAPEPPGLWR